MYQIAIKYTIPIVLKVPNAHKIYQSFPLKGLKAIPKFEFFGVKTNHLATLVECVKLATMK
jgi:hypothetical protein